MASDFSTEPPKVRRVKYLDISLTGRMPRTTFEQHGRILLLSAIATIALASLIFTVSVNKVSIVAIFAASAATLYLLTCLVAWNCAWVRRLHDVGMSGLWLVSGWGLLALPFIGMIFSNSPHVWWLLLPSAIVGIRLQIAAFSPGEPGPNRYGASPLEEETEPEKVH